jgi:hypothetical protein
MIWQGVKTYRWGEEGIAGISDDQQVAMFCPVIYGIRKIPFLKERFFV